MQLQIIEIRVVITKKDILSRMSFLYVPAYK